ncbi:MAG: elongation factor P [Candidatus Aminicenantes bacterium]|nr:elongation factor P [Candidatus Aminicenantes bacterium]
MINATQIRKGIIIRITDRLYRVEEMEHITPGKGQAVVQTKIRNLSDMTIRNYRFRSSEKVERVVLETREVSYLYQDGDQYIFMDSETYEQIGLNQDFLGDVVFYLKENLPYILECHGDKPMNITPPLTMEFEVMETEKSIKGATVQASYKPAKLENGLEVTVPQFIEIGNIVKIDSRDGSYIERINK